MNSCPHTDWRCKPASVRSQPPLMLLIPGQLEVWLASSCSGWWVLLLLPLFGLKAKLLSEALEVSQAHSSHYWFGRDPGLSLLAELDNNPALTWSFFYFLLCLQQKPGFVYSIKLSHFHLKTSSRPKSEFALCDLRNLFFSQYRIFFAPLSYLCSTINKLK